MEIGKITLAGHAQTPDTVGSMKAIFVLIPLIFIVACSPTSRSPNVSSEEALHEIRIMKQMAVREHMGQLERLYRVGMPIMAANAPLCGWKVWPHTGMMVESLSYVPEDYKDAMEIVYGVRNQLTAAYIAPGSPAEGVVKPGDLIVKVDGKDVPSGPRGKKVFYETIWKGDKKNKDVTQPIHLTVKRGRKEKEEQVVLHPVAGCASFLALKHDDEVNAYADSGTITFHTGMMRFAADDDHLASVFAHELTHNAREHIESQRVNELIGSITGVIIEAATGLQMTDILTDLGSEAWSQDFETEADYFSMYMLARAGYDLDKAIDIQRKFAANYPSAIHLDGTSHPSSAKRFLSMKKTIAEIREKQSKGLPLVPNEKTGVQRVLDLEKIN